MASDVLDKGSQPTERMLRVDEQTHIKNVTVLLYKFTLFFIEFSLKVML
jgi:hypothetical protein